MRLLVGSSIAMGIHILLLILGIFGGAGGAMALAFCSLSLWVYPLFCVALYRFFTSGQYRIVRADELPTKQRSRRNRIPANDGGNIFAEAD